MSVSSNAFAVLAIDVSSLLGLLTAILLVCAAGWLACCAVYLTGVVIYLTGVKACIAWRRRRVRVAIRAEVTRGLTDIDKFVQGHAPEDADREGPDD